MTNGERAANDLFAALDRYYANTDEKEHTMTDTFKAGYTGNYSDTSKTHAVPESTIVKGHGSTYGTALCGRRYVHVANSDFRPDGGVVTDNCQRCQAKVVPPAVRFTLDAVDVRRVLDALNGAATWQSNHYGNHVEANELRRVYTEISTAAR